jgi:hypothetical protein
VHVSLRDPRFEQSSGRVGALGAFEVATMMEVPDRFAITDSVRRHGRAVGGLFVEVLALCREAGMVRAGGIAIAARTNAANASHTATRSYRSILLDILEPPSASMNRRVSVVGRRLESSCLSRCAAGATLPQTHRTRRPRSMRHRLTADVCTKAGEPLL